MPNKKELYDLFVSVVQAAKRVPNRPALLVKLASDLSYEERKDVADVIMKKECKVDGLIISNTTVFKPDSLSCEKEALVTGGLSGKPLKTMSTQMVADMYQLTNGMPIIGK
ncbi:hypothetical protein HHI36_022354 [Cryptolaemus montrouzieri]|uniref:Dihydroorotate dehydrogenase catalytic domain-containing protein n=1 Tax=Cryptolaemus montrouzieri TaxID=559131 RepID=A0ABD2MZQ5_9CUCU